MTGKQLGHYLVGEKLGEGGMGIVYMGTDTRLKRPVALKFLTRALPSDAKERKRFLREARAASSVNHPNVCVIHAIEEVEGEEFIVMEFVEGITLRKWAHRKRDAQRSKLLPLKDILAVLHQVAEGLDAAHKKGIVHRDVKPENIMITADGRVKIMDFGLAKLAGESKLTRTGATVGTVAYMSPEQVQGGEIDALSDIYSLGVVFYELLAGRTPFIADHAMGMMYAIVNTDPEPVQKVRPGLDAGIAAVVMKCLEKAKKDRYGTLSEVIRDVSAYEEMQRTAVAGAFGGGGRERERVRRGSIIRFVTRNVSWIGPTVVLAAAAAVYFLTGSPPDNKLNNSREEKQTTTSPGQKKPDGALTAIPQNPVDKHEAVNEPPVQPAGTTDAGVARKQEGKKTDRNTETSTEKKTESKPVAPVFAFELLTNRGSNHPRFSEGDTMLTYIRVSRPCTVRVFYHTADGSHYVLTGPRDKIVESAQVNTLVLIDSAACSAPFGAESIQAFATTGGFERIRTKTGDAGYFTIDGSIDAALAASRRKTGSAPDVAFAEREVRITTSAP